MYPQSLPVLPLLLLLLSPCAAGTGVVAAMRCPRQAWLQEQLANDTGDKAVQGQLLHELVQFCLLQAMEGCLSEQVALAEVRAGGVVARSGC